MNAQMSREAERKQNENEEKRHTTEFNMMYGVSERTQTSGDRPALWCARVQCARG